MNEAIIDQWSQSSKKVLFLYNLAANQFDYLGSAFESLWEIKRNVVLQSAGQLLSAIDPDDQPAVVMRYEKVRQGQACDIEFVLVLADSRQKHVKVDAHPISDESGALTHIMGQAEDVTPQALYREYLMEFSRKKNNVLQIVAHDLQGPLAIMKGVASLVETDHAEQKYEELTTYTQLISQAYEDCTKLIHQVLLDEHSQSVATPVRLERFDAIKKVRQTAYTFVKAQVVKVPIHVESPEEKIMVELDEVKFTQILNNLITNSIKFTPPEGEIKITLEQSGTYLVLTHTDTGIGIPVALQPYLFERKGNRAMRPGLNGEKPNGIGLSIVKDLVEMQGGKLELESQEGKGTTFYLTFPLLA